MCSCGLPSRRYHGSQSQLLVSFLLPPRGSQEWSSRGEVIGCPYSLSHPTHSYFYFLNCVNVCMCVCGCAYEHLLVSWDEGVAKSYTQLWVDWCGYWELNCPPQEQNSLLISEPSPPPSPTFIFLMAESYSFIFAFKICLLTYLVSYCRELKRFVCFL